MGLIAHDLDNCQTSEIWNCKCQDSNPDQRDEDLLSYLNFRFHFNTSYEVFIEPAPTLDWRPCFGRSEPKFFVFIFFCFGFIARENKFERDSDFRRRFRNSWNFPEKVENKKKLRKIGRADFSFGDLFLLKLSLSLSLFLSLSLGLTCRVCPIVQRS